MFNETIHSVLIKKIFKFGSFYFPFIYDGFRQIYCAVMVNTKKSPVAKDSDVKAPENIFEK